MGYLPETAPFLDRAMFFADPCGVVVHYHHLAGPHEVPIADMIGACADTSVTACDAKFGVGFRQVFEAVARWNDRRRFGTCQLAEFVTVKSYAPKIDHCVADIKITWSNN